MIIKDALWLVVLAVVSVAILLNFPNYTVDDAYIIFRYAANLVDFGELNWNVGEDPVEGYTGVALSVLIASLYKLGISPLVASKVIGVGSYVLTAVTLYCISVRLNFVTWVRILTLALFCGAPFFYIHAISGLETMLYTLFITTSILALYNYLSKEVHDSRSLTLLCISLLAVSLTRPEGVLMAAITFLGVAVYTFILRKGDFRGVAMQSIMIFAIPAILYFIARYSYYGQLFPNTFYVKVQSDSLFQMESVWAFERYLTFFIVPLLLAALLITASFRQSLGFIMQQYRPMLGALNTVAVVSALFVILSVTFYLHSNLIMNYAHRFFSPITTIIILWVAFLLNAGWNSVAKRGGKLTRAVAVFIAIAITLQGGVYAKGYPEQFHYTTWYSQTLADEHISIGKWINKNIPKDEWLTVHSDAGAIPYYSQLKTVDFGALNDENIIKLNAHERVDYFYSYNPGVAVMTSFNENAILEKDKKQSYMIIQDPRFKKYKLVKKYGSSARPKYFEFLYVREDLLRT